MNEVPEQSVVSAALFGMVAMAVILALVGAFMLGVYSATPKRIVCDAGSETEIAGDIYPAWSLRCDSTIPVVLVD